MLQTSPSLFNLLQNSKEFVMCDLHTIITNTGTTLRYTSGSFDITLPGPNILPGNIGFQTGTSTFSGYTLGTNIFDQYTMYMTNPTWQTTTTAGWGEGIITNPITLLPNTKYLATGIIMAPLGTSLTLIAGDAGYWGADNFVATGVWEQFNTTFTTGASPMTDAVVGFVTNSVTAVSFHVANFQIMQASVFYSSAMRMKRGPIKLQVGVEVDTLDMTFYPRSTDIVGVTQFLTAIRTGAFDNAIYEMERAFFIPINWETYSNNITGPPVPTYIDKICRFKGFVCEIDDWSAVEVPMTIKSALMLLDLDMPRLIYQSQCRNTLFDSACKLVQTTYATNVIAQQFTTQNQLWITPQNQTPGTVGIFKNVFLGKGDGTSTDFSTTLQYVPSGCQDVKFNGDTTLKVTDYSVTPNVSFSELYEIDIAETSVTVSFPVAPIQNTIITGDFPYTIAAYYDLGTVTCTSGANIGFNRTIKTYQPLSGNGEYDILQFSLGFPFPIVIGDTFTIYVGCDKLQSTCLNKFNNLTNFTCEPFIPCPETAA